MCIQKNNFKSHVFLSWLFSIYRMTTTCKLKILYISGFLQSQVSSIQKGYDIQQLSKRSPCYPELLILYSISG